MNDTEGPPGTEPYLQWEFRPEDAPPGHFRAWHPNEVVLRAADGRELWRRTLPERMRSCRAAPEDLENQRRYPRNPQLTFLLGMAWTDAAVAVADRETVLVLGRGDGRVLLDASFPMREAPFWCDAGEFRVLGPDGAEEGAGKVRGGRFFARCGGEWLYFNGSTLASIDPATASVRETAPYDAATHATPRPHASVRSTIPFGRRTVQIDGVIFM